VSDPKRSITPLRGTITGRHTPALSIGIEFDEIGHQCTTLPPVDHAHRIYAKQHIHQFEVKAGRLRANREIFPSRSRRFSRLAMTPNATTRAPDPLEVRSYSGRLSPTRSALLEILNVDTAGPSDS
jgi:hypothetical protein